MGQFLSVSDIAKADSPLRNLNFPNWLIYAASATATTEKCPEYIKASQSRKFDAFMGKKMYLHDTYDRGCPSACQQEGGIFSA